jgi:hypothetical protein
MPCMSTRLDGLVETAFFEKMSNQWRDEQNRCLREVERHQEANKCYMDEGVQLLELAQNVQRLFAKQDPREKRRLLNFLLSNCTWEDGEVVATFRQPFAMLAKTAMAAAHFEADETAKSSKIEIWLPFLDTYRTLCIAPEPQFEQILEQIRAWRPSRLNSFASAAAYAGLDQPQLRFLNKINHGRVWPSQGFVF